MLGFNNYDEREIKKLEKKADSIIALDKKISMLSDKELSGMTNIFKKRLSNGETLDDLLVEAFAVCREASYRILGKKQYKVQLMGGIVIHQGRVAEMKTGEGKTLTELCPAYLNALRGKGVHVITVNDYLSERDKEEMEPLFNFLNLSVGLVIESTENRRVEYRKDITYSTNTEIGFDYLRDNIVYEVKDKVMRALNYVIIDEIDSILIDEARTPLIISTVGEESTDIYKYINSIISTLQKSDYEIDREDNTILLNEDGIEKVEKMLNVKNIADVRLSEVNHIIAQSLRANFLMKRDKDYIIRDGEVVIIDEGTGRISEGRRFSDGLHQCLEAKENVEINEEARTLATITYQNLFKLYNKVSGMSGTVKTEEWEFKEIYDLDVVVIPTNKEIKRIDYKDLVYPTKKAKFNAVIRDIISTNEVGRPVLVGTSSIENSEILSRMLNKRGIKHNLLNAKNKAEEAEIVARAGEYGAITIATNMAGRGTDIKITDAINNLGGLRVIGTERAESKRIDNQLIGRAGRQGNNGSSQFYISIEDDLLVNHSKKKFSKKDVKTSIAQIRKEVEKAQRVVGGKNFETRKETVKYNEVINNHRKMIYRERDLILFGQDIRVNITRMILELNSEIVKELAEEYKIKNLNQLSSFNRKIFMGKLLEKLDLHYRYSFEEQYKEYKFNKLSTLDELVVFCTDELIEYFNKLIFLDIINFEEHIKRTMLSIIDENWVRYLNNMELLKQRVRSEVYMQKDPVQVYNKESLNMYNDLIKGIKYDFIEMVFKDIIPEIVMEYSENYCS
ncbi:preprotein translocase subunit SecA [Clostridium massiliamazoniense]|uniref:preprotein translocase subunit SecA n=1 Tax=Clostridium massiliamazoniense TaxID=1347366 RepID=UPI0006D76524|nr:preprotein translocase subunit SecA [Clostridium massiliamazoniense]